MGKAAEPHSWTFH